MTTAELPVERTWSLRDLFEMGEAALALIAAYRAGLVGALLDGPATPAELARELELDERATRLVLNVLWVYGAASRSGEEFSASAELLELRRAFPGGVSLDLELLDHEETFLRTGKPLIRMDGSLDERGGHFVQVAGGLGKSFRQAARELAESAGGSWRDVLDLGAGSGVWGLALAERWPAVTVTAVDLPPVVRVLRRNAEELGVADRVRTVAGSYFDVDLPERAFDCVVLGNLLHLELPEDAQRLIASAAGKLRPGGTLVLVDILGSGRYEPSPERANYALFLAMRTESGQVHPRERVESWLREAGLETATDVRLPSAPPILDVVLAR